MGTEPKQFYVANRNPGFADREEFCRNWRGHGRLAMEQPLWENIFRYTQGDTLTLPPDVADRIESFEPETDGVATLWFNNFDAMTTVGEASEYQLLLEDETRIFAEMVSDVSMYTEEDILVEKSHPQAKLVLFLEPLNGASQADFESSWRTHAEQLSGLSGFWPHVVAYRLNYVRPLPGGQPPSSLDDFKGVCEIGFSGREGLIDAVRDPDFPQVLEGLSTFAVTGRALATSELLLDDR
jgi:hypothetical protein